MPGCAGPSPRSPSTGRSGPAPPRPGAWTTLGQARIKLWPLAGRPAAAPDACGPLAPGELRVQRTSVLVGTATTPVELGDVQPPGKRRMPAAEWARGLRRAPRCWPTGRPERAARHRQPPAEPSRPARPATPQDQPHRKGQPRAAARRAAPAAAPDGPATAHRPGPRRRLDVLTRSTSVTPTPTCCCRRAGQRGLDGRDAALATELAYGTLRGRGTYDAVLGRVQHRGLAGIDPPLLDVLRLGTHQLLATRIRPHAAVATSVALARDAGRAAAGRVRQRGAPPGGHPGPGDLDRGRRTGRASRPARPPRGQVQPSGLDRRRASDALGEEPPAGCRDRGGARRDGVRPRVTLCAVPGLAEPADLVAGGAAPARWSPFGAYLDGGDPGAITEVRQRRAAVQDEASQLAALALARGPSCAGPDRPPGSTCAPGPAARRGCSPGWRQARRPPARRRRHGAPGPAGPRGAARSPAPAAVVVADGTEPAWRPGTFDRVHRRRAVHRPRRAAPPPGRPLAQDAGRRRGARPAAAPRCCAARSTPPGRAG